MLFYQVSYIDDHWYYLLLCSIFLKSILMQLTFITSIWWNPNCNWIFNTQYKKIKLSWSDNFQVNSLPCHVFATNFLNIFPFAKPLKITTLNITLKRLQSHLNKRLLKLLYRNNLKYSSGQNFVSRHIYVFRPEMCHKTNQLITDLFSTKFEYMH